MKTKTKLLTLPVLGLLSATLAFSGSTALAATINVPGDSSTIQAAINAAAAGDTINVAAGTYPEQLTVAKALTISGADGAVLDGATLGLQKVGVKIKSGHVTFDNVDVANFSGNGIIVGYEASIPGSLQNVHITNCKISGIQPGYSHGFGIYVGYQSEDFKRPTPPKLTAHLNYSGLLIENNEITDSRSSSLVLQSITGDPGTLMVRNNYIHDNDNDGIWIDSARNINIEGNTVANNPDGIYISSYGDAFQGVIGGVWVYDWSNQQLNGPYGPMNISITGNTIVDNNTWGGVYLQAGYPATIAINENVITGNAPGVANFLSEQVNATCNWWGDANGPGPVGPGSGDTVSQNVTFAPWLLSAPVPIDGINYTGQNLFPAGTINLSAKVDYLSGDGSEIAVVFTVEEFSPIIATTIVGGTASATITLPAGVYNITVGLGPCSTFGDTQFLAVYDPTAGFVTGGGWIWSPAGALETDLDLEGKATFGFVSKYQKGATVPTGNTEFQFKAGALNFKSTSYDWLVIAGARAQYKGAGTINGAGEYRFMLTAIDGQVSGGGGVDKFRIRIWDDAGGKIYDNQLGASDTADPSTALGGGSIVIHK